MDPNQNVLRPFHCFCLQQLVAPGIGRKAAFIHLSQGMLDEKDWPKLDFIGLDYYYGISSLRPDLILSLMNAGSKGDFDQEPYG